MKTHTTHTKTQAKHTAGPWAVMPCPINHGKHPFHDSRWIATQDAEVEFGHDPRSWGLGKGTLICEMRDGPAANAQLIASAPDLLAALKAVVAALSQPVQTTDLTDADRSRLAGVVQIMRGDCAFAVNTARSAIARATGQDRS